jgi:hypothetical protein
MKSPMSIIALVALSAAALSPASATQGSGPLLLQGESSPTPVMGSFTAFLTDENEVILRWTLDEGTHPDAINVYRGTARSGPFERLNPEPLEAVSPGVYIDDTIWEGTCFWYELRMWFSYESDGFEFPLSGSPAYITTGGSPPMALLPPRPNPSPGQTHIGFDVPDVDATVELVVYNARGQLVKTLVRDSMEPGPHGVDWCCVDSFGSPVAGGVYFVRLRVGAEQQIRKVLVIR